MQKSTTQKFTQLEEDVMFNQATERAFSGEYDDFYKVGDYVCKNCNNKLYSSHAKFDAGCGWPAFDDTYLNAVKRITDKDGRRVEIICNNCGIHLGHVFEGEQLTDKNTRHCVNSVSIKFTPATADLINEKNETNSESNIAEIIVGCGCFWGVEYWFKKLEGVISSEVGYSGGHLENPSYEDVLSHKSGHREVVIVKYDTTKTTIEKVLKYFFEIHDFGQKDGQGNDIGEQYLSVIYYNNEDEKSIAQNLISKLESKGLSVATDLLPANKFFKAEQYHQDYYGKNGHQPYCHFYKPIFKD
jgi:peptide methionine sulfoxide reductase msrA/msrB